MYTRTNVPYYVFNEFIKPLKYYQVGIPTTNTAKYQICSTFHRRMWYAVIYYFRNDCVNHF